jgi:hypothetical protein
MEEKDQYRPTGLEQRAIFKALEDHLEKVPGTADGKGRPFVRYTEASGFKTDADVAEFVARQVGPRPDGYDGPGRLNMLKSSVSYRRNDSFGQTYRHAANGGPSGGHSARMDEKLAAAWDGIDAVEEMVKELLGGLSAVQAVRTTLQQQGTLENIEEARSYLKLARQRFKDA